MLFRSALASICFIVISCYGGGFGTMPAFAADLFGAKWVGSIYGLMLTAWGFAGVFGPLLIANIRQSTGKYDLALVVIALIMLVSSVLPLIVRNPYLSTWLGNARDAPWVKWPMFYTGEEVGLALMAHVPSQGIVYPLVGKPQDFLASNAGY